MNPWDHVSVSGALAYYEQLRKVWRRDPGLSRVEAINRAMEDLWVRLLAPYRVFSESATADGVVRWHVVVDYNDKNYGHVEKLWVLRGPHRERDAVRLSIVLRNEFMRGVREGRHEFSFIWPTDTFVRERAALIAHLNAQWAQREE